MASPGTETSPQRIRILTLNCWGLKYIAKDRVERLSEIGRQISLAEPPPEIVGLQECWTQEDYQSIREQTRHILPYGKFYYSGIFGGGLAILSRWPIDESSMFAYPLNGRPTAFFRGDWFVGKGVACARIRTGPRNEDITEVFCTHLHAPYESEPNDSYICHRTAQAWEIARLMRGAAERGHLVIGLGDFNMLPLSFAHRLITAHAPVRDVWRHLYPDSSIGPAVANVEKERGKPVPTAEFNILENGATCDSALNTWRWNKGEQKKLAGGENVVVAGNTSDPKAKRLDYIFIGDGSSGQAGTTTPSKWNIESARITMTERHPTLHCSLSDHFGVEATITREPSTNPSPTNQPPNTSLTPETYDSILGMISTYIARERFQRRARLGHFILSVFIAIACFVAIWWSPRNFVSFILILLSTLSLSAGVIDGLIGGLFVGSEIRALKEFRWEVENAKRIAVSIGSTSGSRGSVEGNKEIESGQVS